MAGTEGGLRPAAHFFFGVFNPFCFIQKILVGQGLKTDLYNPYKIILKKCQFSALALNKPFHSHIPKGQIPVKKSVTGA